VPGLVRGVRTSDDLRCSNPIAAAGAQSGQGEQSLVTQYSVGSLHSMPSADGT
jgi:hypothetical protein